METSAGVWTPLSSGYRFVKASGERYRSFPMFQLGRLQAHLLPISHCSARDGPKSAAAGRLCWEAAAKRLSGRRDAPQNPSCALAIP